jgi:hypothetical protein
MCLIYSWTNAKDANNILGKKYIDICERHDPIISRLVEYLSAIIQGRRSYQSQTVSGIAGTHKLPVSAKQIDRMPLYLRYFPYDYESQIGGALIFWFSDSSRKWQLFSGFLATLNDAGFPRRALYELVRKHAEDHDVDYIITAEDKSSFITLTNKRSKRDTHGIAWKCGCGKKKWEAWQLACQQSGIQSHVTVNGIYYPVRYIDHTEVDWWMEREKIIVAKDFQTVTCLWRLKDTGIWNFAHNLNEIKSINECWQNILISKHPGQRVRRNG